MTEPRVFRLRARMTARDKDEPNRASSPLELLFDLTFVVAVSQIVLQLAHGIEAGRGGESVLPFVMVFFAIWWAWMNFTWFASAYDTDDVPYRLLTMLQMAGVLVLAAGVPSAFDGSNFTTITVGYLIMRVALATQWVRAAVEHGEGRSTAARYAGGIVVVQLGWVARLFLPLSFAVPAFFGLAVLELCVPPWAERPRKTDWHTHHIAERYGLFTIILLGESVAAATTGVQAAVARGAGIPLVIVGVAGLVILFAIWWLYFLEPAGESLAVRRHLSYLWGYGHYVLFAALAAVGTGLEVAVQSSGHGGAVAPVVAAYSVAIPVAIFVIALWGVNAIVIGRPVLSYFVALPAAGILLLVPLAGDALGLPAEIAAVALVVVAVVGATIARKSALARGLPSDGT